MKLNTILNSFVAGEISPRLAGRTDITQYYQSAAEITNMIVEFYGGAKKNVGTYFVAEVKNSSLATRIFKFIFSDTQAYLLEFGNNYIRFFKETAGVNGSILLTADNITGASRAVQCLITCANTYTNGDEVYISGVTGMTELNGKRFLVSDRTALDFKIKTKAGVYVNSSAYTVYAGAGTSEKVYEVVTTYTTAQIPDLQFAQTADILYITHPDHPQAKLTRTGHTAWTLTPIDYSVVPAIPAMMETNLLATTITPSADVGVITLTASVAMFYATHVGSVWRIKSGYVKITAVAAGGPHLTATANVIYGGNLATGPAATTNWAEGSWSGYRGYPKCVTISEGRLLYGYTHNQPQTVWGSVIASYDTFLLGVLADDAIEFTADTNKVEVINWIYPSQEILVGTPSGVSSLGTGSDSIALSATTGRMKKKAGYGTSSVMPQSIGNNIFYWQKYGRILREYVYTLSEDNYIANDATVLSDHITESGIIDMDYQQSPLNILWCVRADGKLVSFTRQIEQKVSAWAYHSTDGYYESVAVIPRTSYDEVWFVVKRTIGNVTKRYIEYMVAPEFTEIEDAFFVHSGLTLDNPETITGITAANPPVVSCVNTLSDGDIIKIRNVVGMTEVNDRKFIVAGRAAGSFHLHTLAGVNVDGSTYTAYVSGGESRECFDSISGLDHLEGKTVQILADGSSHPDRVVASGTITLDDHYSQLNIGLGYTGRLKSNDLEGAPGRINSQGQVKRVSKVSVNLYNTVGCKVGDGVLMDDIVFRTSGMPTDQAIPLFTGIKEIAFGSGWAKEKQVVIEQTQPLPLHVRSIILEAEVN